jgi:hypothetical protein
LRDARQVCPIRKWVAMFGGPLFGEVAAEWEGWVCGTGAEERGAPALLDTVQELIRCRSSFQSLSLSEPCMTVPDKVWSQRCTGRF